MKHKHIVFLTRSPQVAQSGLVIKLEGTTAIIDRLLLAQRQAPWKYYDTGGTDGGGTDPDPDEGGGLGGEL